MGRSVIITTPFPSVEEVAKQVGVSKARLRVLRKIVDGTYVEPPRKRSAKAERGVSTRSAKEPKAGEARK